MTRGVRLPVGAPDRNVSGQHRKFELEEPFGDEIAQLEEIDAAYLEDASPKPVPVAELDPLLEYAEREGQLLARVAEQEREITQLRNRLERTENALAECMEQLAKTAIHESPTNPPPKPDSPTSPPGRIDVPDDAIPSTRP